MPESTTSDWITAIASVLAAGGAIVAASAAIWAAWLAYPRKPDIKFEDITIAKKDVRNCKIKAEVIVHKIWQVHFTFTNNARKKAIKPQISLRVPIDYIPMHGVHYSEVDKFEKDHDEKYDRVPMEGYPTPRAAMIDKSTKEPHRDIHSSIFDDLKTCRLPNNYRRFFLEEMPFMEPQLSYTFWVRLVIPEFKDEENPVILSVSTPKFQHYTSISHEYFLGPGLPRKEC